METIDVINHPYMRKLETELTAWKYKIECLDKRLIMIDDEYKNKSLYEKNEAELIKMFTKNDLAASKKAVSEREQYYIKFMASYIEEMEEVDANYQNILDQANKIKDEYKPVEDYLNRVNINVIEKNTEAKIQFYKKLKFLIETHANSIQDA